MENDSVRSDRTDRSDRNRHRGHRDGREGRDGRDDRGHREDKGHREGHREDRGQQREGRHNRSGQDHYGNHRGSDNSREGRDNHQRRHQRRSGRSRDDRSVTIQSPSGDEGDQSDNRIDDRLDEHVQVQILPQEDRWDTNTAITDATSAYTGYSNEDLSKIEKPDHLIGPECGRWVAPTFTIILSTLAFVSPVAMVLLPKLTLIPGLFPNSSTQSPQSDMSCRPECEGLLISLAFKLFFLLLGFWACFYRLPKSTLPRIFMFRCLVLFLVFVLTFSFWLFYVVRIIQSKYHHYYNIVSFAVSLVDALLFLHYLAVILIEVRHLTTRFIVKVSRSPDGETRCFTLGELSIQRAAVQCLEQYYKEFPTYNPFLDTIPGARRPGVPNGSVKNSAAGKFKMYSIDGGGDVKAELSAATAAAINASNNRRSDRGGHNDRFHEELEYERRVRKRRARLVISAEDAFTHIKRLHKEDPPVGALPMDPYEAAQAIFPSMARALQKFLRITRQQPWHTMDSVLQHLATCIAHDMTPKAFLQRYMKETSILHQSDKGVASTEQWVLVSDQVLSRTIEDGMEFQLKQSDVSILCQIKKVPHISILEEVTDPKKNRFVLRLNSETSV